MLGGVLASHLGAQDYPFRPVPFPKVRVEDGFWRPRLETNRTVTIPYAFQQCEDTGRIENFRVAGGLSKKRWTGDFGFNDSDVSKIIEGASYGLTLVDDPKLVAYLSNLVSLYEAAQEDDGYLYTFQTARTTVPADARVHCVPKEKRWDDIGMAHELYNSGHMYEAAVAHWQATGDRRLLEVAIRNADLVCRTFGPKGIQAPPGHQEIEIGLAKLYRATGERRYLDQCRLFLERRGQPRPDRPSYGSYSQDHLPVLEQGEAVGHAVRANYMYAAMADVAALGGDSDYLAATHRIWRNVVEHKLYLTGGVGASGHGEAYGKNDQLPNRTAYAETCAAIANVYWNHRMFLLHGDSAYIDVLERSLYNGVLSGVSLDGKAFFYPNPLASNGEHGRSSWFGCACCPSNITRFLASLGGYVYAVKEDSLYVNLYVAGKVRAEVDGKEIHLKQETQYPWNGRILIEFLKGSEPSEFSLQLRLPGWARGKPVPSDLYRYRKPGAPQPRLSVNGREISAEVNAQGYLELRRPWKQGDRVELEMAMPVRQVLCAETVEANRGRVALERGPLVYCVEHPDVPGGKVHHLVLQEDEAWTPAKEDGLLGGITVLEGNATATRYQENGSERRVVEQEVKLRAIPYHLWAHRGRGEMAVWLAKTREFAFPLPAPTTASMAIARASGGDVGALNDQREPKSSGDHTHTFLHWWPRKGTLEWVQYDFKQPVQVQGIEVYWFDDTGRGECRLPASWRLLYRGEGDEWIEVPEPDGYPVLADRFNQLSFQPVLATSLRLEVQLQPGWSAGIHEWKVRPK
ncbi:MAG: glycoside hydrolase family 127 protein [Planctomycetota bacterium]|nr:MAG: glycoside hydrolase family 127 protein [Planctomycetota bacterium]